MENPLKQLVPVEERIDGVYIKVGKDTRADILINAMLKALDTAGVLNDNPELIKDVVARSRGAFEKIGPPFEYYNQNFDKYVEVAASPLSASVKVSSACIADGIRMSENLLLYCLQRKGVRYGIDKDAVMRIIQEAAYDVDITIAEGVPAVDGENGTIRYEVKIAPDARPKQLDGGGVDFKNIQTFAQVAQGQTIAKRMPPTAGTPGKSVSGDIIPAKPGEGYKMFEGENIGISDDGNHLIAKKSGLIYEEKGALNIREQLGIPGDVDFSVGNVRFCGSVQINGNVLPGFVVESDEDIVINGEVESAAIKSRNGMVTIKKGVIGKGTTQIFGKKGVRIAFVQNAAVSTEGVLTIDKYCLHCECTCDTFEVSGNKTMVVGGHISAYSSIKAAIVGNDEGAVTKLSIVDKEKAILSEKLKELETLRQKMEKDILPIQQQLNAKAAIFKRNQDAMGPKQKEELKKWIDQYNSMKMKLEYVVKKIAQMEDELSKPRMLGGFIKITGDIFPGIQIDMYGLSKLIKTQMSNKQFVIKNFAIEVEG